MQIPTHPAKTYSILLTVISGKSSDDSARRTDPLLLESRMGIRGLSFKENPSPKPLWPRKQVNNDEE
jgi:hypothetical protein